LTRIQRAFILAAEATLKEHAAMANQRHQDPLVREAKAIVALTFRNGPIEELHAGRRCPVCQGDTEYSHITQDEMKLIMKNAVTQVYKLLRMKADDPDGYERQIAHGERFTRNWDDPEKV
jgi:hypothetical protein